ncbi:MAG TPA: ATP-binding protein [Candidatus Dormibacteraeota bacterium]
MRDLLRRTRVRLTLAVAGAFLAVAAIAATGLWLGFAHVEYQAVDTSLSSQAQTLLSALQDANGRLSFQGGEALPGETPEGIAVGALLEDVHGRVLDRSGAPPGAAAVAPAAAAAVRTRASVFTTIVDAGRAERVLAVPVDAGGTVAGVVAVSRPVQELRDTLLVLALLLCGGVVLLTAVVASLAWLLAGRALRPVRQIAATARDLSEHDLQRRITLDLPADELGELAATFNGMLARLDTAFTTLQQFTADAAHELRAPLALLRAELEVSLARVRTPEEYEASQRIALAEVERLAALADQLLLLARADAGALQPTVEEVDIGDLVEETAERWRPLAGRRGIEVTAEVHQEGALPGDPLLLRRLLDNLVDNAVRHSPDGGRVRVGVVRGDMWEVTVSDGGPGVPAELRATLFERFARGDTARGRATGGAGLGLALSRAIAGLHGGSIALDPDGGPGARFRVRLPRAARL